jgi:hypothetical protein
VIGRSQSSICVVALAVSAACAQSTAPSPLSPTVDVLTYLVGDATTWPRGGSHAQNQIVDLSRREVCWVKYGNPRRFECWRWDDQYVYHEVDHALDGDSDESYMFTDGRWIARFIPVDATPALPWSLDVPGNMMVWFDAACRVDPSKSHAFPYRQRAWLEKQRDAGGTLGLRDTLVFEYQPYDPAGGPGAAEHYYFGLAVGWYEWERSGFQDFFNRTPGFNTPMDRSVWCQAP